VINYTMIVSPVMFNEFRLGYNRRAPSNPPRPDAARYGITVAGASTESLPYCNIGYSIGGMTANRNVGEDRVLQDNLTRLVGKHSVKVGYEMIWTLYSDEAAALPGGQYNVTGGTSLPFTPNTGNGFAAFEMGVVTSATFTRPQGLFLPRLWDHELYVQDDWKVRSNVSLNLGVRWTYSSPFKTKWNQQSQFDPSAIDPVTGLMGAIIHAKGIIGKRDLNNFQPRLGLSWNFMPKWVFRGSFGVMTSDNNGQGGFDEYNAVYNILQPTGDPRYVFLLKDGPGQVQYKVSPDGTVPYTGASYSSRTATWRDPNLRNRFRSLLHGWPLRPTRARQAWVWCEAGTSTRFLCRSLWAAIRPYRTKCTRRSRITCCTRSSERSTCFPTSTTIRGTAETSPSRSVTPEG
jgi:hypothetical protein